MGKLKLYTSNLMHTKVWHGFRDPLNLDQVSVNILKPVQDSDMDVAVMED